MAKLKAYKVVQTHNARKHPIGQVFLDERWLGHRHEFHRYNYDTFNFEAEFIARYLGPITARTEHGKVRQLLSLRGMARARARAKKNKLLTKKTRR